MSVSSRNSSFSQAAQAAQPRTMPLPTATSFDTINAHNIGSRTVGGRTRRVVGDVQEVGITENIIVVPSTVRNRVTHDTYVPVNRKVVETETEVEVDETYVQPRTEYIDRVVTKKVDVKVPRKLKKVVTEEKLVDVQKIVEVPEIIEVDQIEVKYRDSVKVVDVPVPERVPKVKEVVVTVPNIQEKLVENVTWVDKTRTMKVRTPVPVEATINTHFSIPRLKAKHVDATYTALLPEFVEYPVYRQQLTDEGHAVALKLNARLAELGNLSVCELEDLFEQFLQLHSQAKTHNWVTLDLYKNILDIPHADLTALEVLPPKFVTKDKVDVVVPRTKAKSGKACC